MAVTQLIPIGDLKLVNGNFVFIKGADMIRQNIAARFKFFLGEWFLDQREGVPYYRDVLGRKEVDVDVASSVFRAVLQQTPGVLEIQLFELVFDQTTRMLGFNFECLVEGNELLIVLPDDDAFLVQL